MLFMHKHNANNQIKKDLRGGVGDMWHMKKKNID